MFTIVKTNVGTWPLHDIWPKMSHAQQKTPYLTINSLQTNLSIFVAKAALQVLLAFTLQNIPKWPLTMSSCRSQHTNTTGKVLMSLDVKTIHWSMLEKHLACCICKQFLQMTLNDLWIHTFWQPFRAHNPWVIGSKSCKHPINHVRKISYFARVLTDAQKLSVLPDCNSSYSLWLGMN